MLDQHEWSAVIGTTPVDVLEGSLTMDDSWSPYIQGTLTIVRPASITVLDPRDIVRAVVTVARRFGGLAFVYDLSARFGGLTVAALSAAFGGLTVAAISGLPERSFFGAFREGQSRVFDLHLRRRELNDNGTVSLRVESAECLLRDRLHLSPTPLEQQRNTLRDLINSYHNQPYPGLMLAPGQGNYNIPPGLRPATPTESWTRFEPGQSHWDMFNGFTTAGNLRLWADENRTLQLDSRTRTIPGSVVLSSVNNVMVAGDVIDRDDAAWGTGLLVEFLPNPLDPAAYYRMGVDGPRTGAKFIHVKINAIVPTSDPTALSAIARTMLDRIQNRGRDIPVTAISDYTTTPRMNATINLEGGVSFTGVIQAVSWQFPAARMTITTREIVE